MFTITCGSGKNAPVRKLVGTTISVPRFAACLSFLANDAIIIASAIDAIPPIIPMNIAMIIE